MRAAFLLPLLCLLAGCAGIWPNTGGPTLERPKPETAGERPKEKFEARASEEELRIRVQRFADEFQQAVSEPLDQVLNSDVSLERRKLALDMKYVYGSTAYTIAAGAHGSIAVLDMVVFISLTRDTIERWGVQYTGAAQTEMLLMIFRHFEKRIWELARMVVTPAQEQGIRDYLVEWRENFPNRKSVENIRINEFVNALDLDDRKDARGLVANVQKATASADAALELAERLSYFFQRAPLIWRMHAQLGFFEVISQPEMQTALSNVNQMSTAAERLSVNVDRLANILIEGPQTPEEKAIYENLEGGETRIRALMSDLRQTMDEANALAGNVDGLAVRFGVGSPLEPGETPFDITEYESVAVQITTMSQEMTELVHNLNELLASPNVQERLPLAVGSAQDMSEDFVRYLVVLALVLVFSSILGALVALLGYRYLAARLDARIEKRHHV